MEIIYLVLAIVWSVLCIILFFKIWGMTNDVREIKEKLFPAKSSTQDYRMNALKDDDNSRFKINDIVVSPSYNGVLKIFDIMGGGEYNCKDATTGAKAGFFREEDLTLKQ